MTDDLLKEIVSELRTLRQEAKDQSATIDKRLAQEVLTTIAHWAREMDEWRRWRSIVERRLALKRDDDNGEGEKS